ncbi:MAG: DegT/DnrJ/EryC1/StrS family aminotransferase [Lunatimonas sp.]|uniref:DegT/DnrJ/EryC1/StrS family aminotransferase n=1 Tax=Lunatimonas sp. TaxID=2060141 RepID=UPI00263ACD9E|nr:DegT/DnrJ/EryC1/StrS family aminotransferase [Lunatimonas sp.]MCC5939122.1 DegT/DnrJ/EryC1/StrS family aminotransferase [Lunatimonas sp.]
MMEPIDRRKFLKTNALIGAGAVAGLSSFAPWAHSSSDVTKPALLGGTPIRTSPWPKWPQWDKDKDEELVLKVLRSGVWSRDKVVAEFEAKWAETLGAKRCLTVVNGTNALIAALVQSKIGGRDEVIVSSYTFIATIVAILQTGAMPVFVDSDPETFQLDASKIEEKITPRTRAILPVHILGLPADMGKIMDIAQRHDLVVIEDACQAWLAEWNHQKAGTIGHAGCFSFQNSKNLPMGEGGAIVSDDDDFMDRCFSYHSYGFPYGNIGATNVSAVLAGTKLRLSEYQAAIGLTLLPRLDGETQLRSQNAAYLRSKIEGVPGISPYVLYPEVTRASFHLFPFRYHREAFHGMSREVFLKALQAEGIPCSSGYVPLNDKLYLKDAFESKNYQKMYEAKELDFEAFIAKNQCPETDLLCQETGVWIFQSLLLGTKQDMDDIANAIQKIQANSEALARHQA